MHSADRVSERIPWVQLYVRGEDEVGRGSQAGNISTHNTVITSISSIKLE